MVTSLRSVLTLGLVLGLAVGSAGCKGDDTDTGDTAETDYQGARTVAPEEGWRPIRPQWVDRDVIED